jgi:thiol-disulfide isomerase/thioredoxin
LAIMKIYRTCLVILISTVASGWAQESSSTLSWNDASGNAQSLRDYHGKIVVLNFWATWCVPCQHEMGLLADVQRKYQQRGVVLLGASLDDDKTQGQIAPFAQNTLSATGWRHDQRHAEAEPGRGYPRNCIP